MFFEPEQHKNALKVSDSFALLNKITESGDYELEFSYRVFQTEVIKRNATTVVVSVLSKNIPQPTVLKPTSTGKISNTQIVQNILTQVSDYKIANKEKENYVVAQRRSDITSKINNEILKQLKISPSSDISKLVKPVVKLLPVSALKEGNEIKPILNLIAHYSVTQDNLSSSINTNAQAVMLDLLTKQAIDPSRVIELTDRGISSFHSLNGTLRESKLVAESWEHITQLLNYYVFSPDAPHNPKSSADVTDGSLVEVLVNEISDEIELTIDMVIPSTSIKFEGRNVATFFVKFDLVDNVTGIPIDSVVKVLDLSRFTQLYFTPLTPPTVKIGRTQNSRVNLEIQQTDPGATSIQVFKKVISNSVVEINDYVLIGSYKLRPKMTTLVSVDSLDSSTAIYRVISMGARAGLSSEFTNVVVKPAHYKPIKAIALSAQPTETGVQLEVRHIPQRVSAIQFLGKNKTTFDSDYEIVEDTTFLISDDVRTSDYLIAVDRNVSTDNIYEYVVNLIYDNGDVEITGHTLVEFIQQVPGKVDTQISGLVMTRAPEPNVVFQVSTKIVDTNQDSIKKMLQDQGIYDLFQEDVLREREFLKSLIAHNIQRVNLTTGLREDFGVVTGTTFNDNDLRRNQAIQPLVLGNKYRYEATALIRAPETMFDALVKTRVDSTTKKTYSYIPSKFFHPIALKFGTLLTPPGLKSLYGKEAMSHGLVGATRSIDVSLETVSAKVSDPFVSRFSSKLNLVTWKILGAIDQLDHFIIMTETNGVRKLVGKSHAEFLNGNCQFVHSLTNKDTGVIAYVIIPVFNSYRVGTSARTNPLVL